jgi:acyl carrier protein
MTSSELFKIIKDVLVEKFELNESDIKQESRLFEDLDLDSIDAADLIVHMKQYIADGKIDPESFKSVRTIQDVIEILLPLIP